MSLFLASLGLSVAWFVAKSQWDLSYNHDVAWILHAARWLLEGGSIPEHVFDPNPPLIFWLTMPVVGVADALGLQDLLVMDLCTLALAWGSSAAVAWLLLRQEDCPRAQAWAFAAATLVLFTVLPSVKFSQRDHLIVMLFLPYVLEAGRECARDASSARLRVLLSVCAALAIAIRPYYALAWLAIEAYRSAVRHEAPWARVEIWIVIGLGAVYLGAVLWLAPDWIEEMRTTARLYAVYQSPFQWITPYGVVTALAVVAAPLFRGAEGQRHQVLLLALSAALMYLAAAYQSTNYRYHQLPSGTLALLALLLMGMNVDRMRGAPTRLRDRMAVIPALVAIGSAVVLAGTTLHHVFRPPAFLYQDHRREMVELLQRHADGGAVFFMSSNITAFPVINLAGVDSASRYSCLWPAPGVYAGTPSRDPFPYNAPGDRGPVERAFVDAVVADLQRKQPKVIVNRLGPSMQGFGATTFDYLDYFLMDPRFAAIFEPFRKLTRVGKMDVYVRSTEETSTVEGS